MTPESQLYRNLVYGILSTVRGLKMRNEIFNTLQWSGQEMTRVTMEMERRGQIGESMLE